ncbi:hypothetical protein RND71_001584 [Anisodus tanguticus]|uniref:Uncharacterized protein n=1 Tax=Anisodus tanguticus TaxID=243964 RepID=A0AAE1T151_9SOLA|nr:hypothetical protein RND71_001584 [Anisodus tanguticus]
MATLKECECVPKKAGVGNTSTILALIEAQEAGTAKIQRRKADNALLRVQLAETMQEPGSRRDLEAENDKLQVEKEKLRVKVDELQDKILQDQRTNSERVDRLLTAPTPNIGALATQAQDHARCTVLRFSNWQYLFGIIDKMQEPVLVAELHYQISISGDITIGLLTV